MDAQASRLVGAHCAVRYGRRFHPAARATSRRGSGGSRVLTARAFADIGLPPADRASLGHVDLAYGSVSATACCNASDQAQADLDSTAGGPYTEIEADPVFDAPGETQKRIDAAVASSTLPLLDAGQAATLNALTLRQSISE